MCADLLECLTLIAQNGYAREVDPLVGLCRETWGDDELMGAVVDLPHGPEGRTRLMYAGMMGDPAKVRWLLKKCAADQGLQDNKGRTALFWAATTGHLRTVKAFLREPPCFVDVPALNGDFPLHAAAECGVTDVVEALLSRGSRDPRNAAGATPLTLACAGGKLDTAVALLKAGAEVDSAGADGTTPLHFAALRGHLSIAKLLLRGGAEGEATSALGTPLLIACKKGRRLGTVRLLLGWGASANGVPTDTDDGFSPLSAGAVCGDTQVVAALLAAGADVDGEDESLLQACRGGHCGVVKLLLAAGASTSPSSLSSDSPLLVSAQAGYTDIARALLQHGADVHEADDAGRTALHLACESDCEELAALLLAHGADPNAATSARSLTPWNFAEGHAGVRGILRAAGALGGGGLAFGEGGGGAGGGAGEGGQ